MCQCKGEMYECNFSKWWCTRRTLLSQRNVELGLDVIEMHDVQKEIEDVEECLEEILFGVAILDVDEVACWRSLLWWSFDVDWKFLLALGSHKRCSWFSSRCFFDDVSTFLAMMLKPMQSMMLMHSLMMLSISRISILWIPMMTLYSFISMWCSNCLYFLII